MSLQRSEITTDAPRVIPRNEHPISRKNISPNALKVLYRLQKSGFKAYLVGGSVRDLLLGREPKDFDVATNALPEEINQLFRNCRLIGRRFRLAHIHFGGEIIEVATFRGPINSDDDALSMDNGMIVRDNAYGSMQTDAWRRDFTVNSLYYSVEDFTVIDYVGALADLQACVLRPIGDPALRFREDPVRMLRAVRFAAKLGFQIEHNAFQSIMANAEALWVVPAARLFDEILKLFLTGCAEKAFDLLQNSCLLTFLLPLTAQSLEQAQDTSYGELLESALRNTDMRVAEDKPVTPAFLMAALLWPPMRLHYEKFVADGEKQTIAMQNAADLVVNAQLERIAVPRRFSVPMRDIWNFQLRLDKRSGKRPLRVLSHPRFRAAYDFLLLRAQSGEGEDVLELAQWWTKFQDVSNNERQRMVRGPKRADNRRFQRKKKTGSN